LATLAMINLLNKCRDIFETAYRPLCHRAL
jgi:hypothetical protein